MGWSLWSYGQSLSVCRLKKTRVRMISLLFLCIGLTVAVTPDNIKIIQEQSAMVAEASLSQVMSRCMLK